MKFSLIFFFLLVVNNCYPKGIIIADEQKQTELFGNKDSNVIIRFADTVALQYDKVIMHLGREFVFRKGNIFSKEINRKNLSVFCRILKKKEITVILWFFDSYGSENFINLFNNHKEIINENIEGIIKNNIYYDGIAVDLEWINLYNNNNNDRFIELMKYLKTKVQDKKIYYFTSLIDSPDENINRGYDLNKINKIPAIPITMLYINNGGFVKHKKSIVPNINDNRIKELKKYYNKNNWNIAYSLGSGFINKTNNKYEFIGMLNQDTVKKFTILKKTHKAKYYIIYDFVITEPFSILPENGIKISFNKNEMLYLFRHTNKLPDRNCFLWEYFSIQATLPEKSK